MMSGELSDWEGGGEVGGFSFSKMTNDDDVVEGL